MPTLLHGEDLTRGRLRAVESLARAVALAVEMNQRDLRDRAVEQIISLTGDLLDLSAAPFGLIYRLLEVLHVRRLEPDVVRNLIERACTECGDNLQLHLAFLHMLRVMTPEPIAQKDINRRTVMAMIDHAKQNTGMLRLLDLNDAATAARDLGMPDLLRDVTLMIQSMGTAELGLVTTRVVTLQLSQDEVDLAHAEIDGAADLAEALRRVVGTWPPAGNLDFARRAATEMIRTAPLRFGIAQGAVNPVGPVPVAAASSDALANAQAEFQLCCLQRRGLAVAAMLDRIGERFCPSEQDLEAAIAHDVVGSASKTRMLLHAFLYYWAGNDDAAVHLALPRVEDLLREIERGRDVPVVGFAKGAAPGGVTQLGTLIAQMPAAGFDGSWSRSFALLLTDGEHGLNLRNDVGHGLCDCPPRHHVALVLHAALFLLAVAHGVVALQAPGGDKPN
ncbi:hypothetical protein OG455_21395 [Kitasatospora sp. NBC_01287]|uniref:hypothetical protein n=1 Tax=Kitasatospora sp. NBC_01287 TaxID=2903573 RepID=UPI00225820EF|nr:hypothetical protein [Kitasatospora sp. NBC_01287]MCX4748039.1 hypothetical protein [Kitasatospora sp. NBC_01287]